MTNLSLIEYPFDDPLKRGKLCNFINILFCIGIYFWKMIKLVIFYLIILNAIFQDSFYYCDLILINNFITKGNIIFPLNAIFCYRHISAIEIEKN